LDTLCRKLVPRGGIVVSKLSVEDGCGLAVGPHAWWKKH
jgi:hypothetical protein